MIISSFKNAAQNGLTKNMNSIQLMDMTSDAFRITNHPVAAEKMTAITNFIRGMMDLSPESTDGRIPNSVSDKSKTKKAKK